MQRERESTTANWLNALCLLGMLIANSHVSADKILSSSLRTLPLVLHYPRPMRDADFDSSYPVQLLSEALHHCEIPHQLLPSRDVMVQSRAIRDLQQNINIDFMWTMTSVEREEELLPIRIPIYKGLYGWRLLLILSANQQMLQKVKTQKGLKAFDFIQGHDWPDTAILRANGLQVATSTSFDSLFNMLKSKRGVLFPRSVLEIWWEKRHYQGDSSLAIEKDLVLHYPSAMYFFVNKTNTELADTLDRCLMQLHQIGKFDEIFRQHHQVYLDQAAIHRRRIIHLHNPLLPKETPLSESAFWYQPIPPPEDSQ
ncbi:hypothetical protein P2G88_03195 [Aliiglaciecola sp. CAU 1673]|uniref:hypothetical protein n=1 Tax=Aliiglaciecola sp. CAU 1673 TaxID=3032595 RepID=UPI0023DC9F6D|nr:hypothetical protein [Aliiglaciecola sp. CAU 1673]MDF2177247.1 hypothetical protein [Aliiglaciecola sp. CAU 1673]